MWSAENYLTVASKRRKMRCPCLKVYNHSEPVRVDLGMALIHLDLDEKVSVLEVNTLSEVVFLVQGVP